MIMWMELIMQIKQLTISSGYTVTLSEYGWKTEEKKYVLLRILVQGWKAVGRQLEDYKEKRNRYENLLLSFDVH